MRKVAFILTAALFALPALGDVVHLKNGGTLEGQVTLTPDGAVVKLPVGEVRVSNDAIARIEKKETAFDQYLKRAAGIKEDDAEGHYQLGVWAQGAGLAGQARDEFGKTLALRPDHEGAHAALGHKKVDGKWMTPEQEMQAKGLVQREGQWMTPEVAAKFDAMKAELEAARQRRAIAEAEVQRAPGPQPAPTYTYGAYYATRPAVSSYYATVPYYGYYPYIGSSYYGSSWPSFSYVRPYPYYSSYWPGYSFSYGWYGGHYSGRPSGGHSGGHSGGPSGGPSGGHSGGRPGPRR